MKQKIVSLVLAGVMAAAALTGCGGDTQESQNPGIQDETPEEKPEEGSKEKSEEKPEDSAEGENDPGQEKGGEEEDTGYVECLPAVEGVEFKEYVKDVEINGAECFAYFPAAENLVESPEGNPIIMVYGEERYTHDSAMEQAKESGLADIAAREGSVILFVNPLGEEWEEADADTYLEALSNSVYNSEFTFLGDAYVGEHGTDLLPGSTLRINVIGQGKGADFAARYLAKNITQVIDFGDGNSLTRQMPPTSLILVQPTEVPAAFEDDAVIPTAVIAEEGKEADWKPALEQLCKGKSAFVPDSSADGGFNRGTLEKAYEQIGAGYMRQNGALLTIPDYEAAGVMETLEEFQAGDARYEGYVYTSKDLDMSQEGAIPLVLGFTGGVSAQSYGWKYDWPLVAGENDFILILFNKYAADNSSVSTVPQLVDALAEKYPAVDTGRVYVISNSFGTAREGWNLAYTYPEKFAGIMCSGFECFYNTETTTADLLETIMGAQPLDTLEIKDVIVPFIYEGATDDVFTVTPNNSESIAQDVGIILQMNQVTDSYSYDAAADEIWGIKSDKMFFEGTGKDRTDCTIRAHGYKSGDGGIYTMFVDSNPQITNDNAWFEWDFLKHFSRNEDGTIQYTE